jgi:hypothetical protein
MISAGKLKRQQATAIRQYWQITMQRVHIPSPAARACFAARVCRASGIAWLSASMTHQTITLG